MIRLLAPWALTGVVLLAGPLLVHMLLRRNARRVMFPATQFLPPTRAAAVRIRRPSDLGLMMLRIAIVAAAVAAAAQPIVMSRWRLSQWNARTIRALVIDTGSGGQASADTMRLAEQEARGFQVQRFAGTDLRDLMARAAAWLDDAAPGRREIVVVSDFQRGEFDADDVAGLPSGIGLRMIRAATQPAARDVALPAVSGFRGGVWQPSLRVESGATAATWTRSGDAASLSWLTTVQPPAEEEAAQRALRAAASFGVAAGDDARRVRVRFAGAPDDSAGRRPLRERWMVDAALALRQSPLLEEAEAAVTTAEQGGELLVDTTITASAAGAAAVLRAIILAVRPASIADPRSEVVTASDADLASWRREPAPVTSALPSGPDADSDARWLWLFALTLLGLETWVRRTRDRTDVTEISNAA